MPFKADTSFLKFLTMGVEGARRTIEAMREAGLQPIELERYCTSNKIWASKVKRLRLPDLLCLRTGARVEVRAKTDLAIRMSDAPANPDRTWDAGMRDEDVAAFVACGEDADGTVRALGPPNCFAVGDLRAASGSSKLGPPKSAGEGAERDRTWPSCVPSGDGQVLEVGSGKIATRMATGRAQTFQLGGSSPKKSYVVKGDKFIGGATIIAGTVERRIDLSSLSGRTWDPISLVESENDIDRYAAAKALGYASAPRVALKELKKAHATESEPRVKLEMAGAIARLSAADGVPLLTEAVKAPERPDLRIEAVLILTELGSVEGAAALKAIASSAAAGDEVKQAAVWGLGLAGAKDYAALVPFLSNAEPDVRLHAISAFGADASAAAVRQLIDLLASSDPVTRASASEALRLIGGSVVLRELVRAAAASSVPWVLSTLGRLPAAEVRAALSGSPLLERIEPLLLSRSPEENWMAAVSVEQRYRFLLQQVPQKR